MEYGRFGKSVCRYGWKKGCFCKFVISSGKGSRFIWHWNIGVGCSSEYGESLYSNVTSSPIKAEGFLNYMGEQAAGNSKVGVNVPGILGSIWEYNNAINTDNAFIIGKGTHHVIIKKNQMENVSNPILDLIDEKQKIGAKYIVTDIK